jgi:hypothetical protein
MSRLTKVLCGLLLVVAFGTGAAAPAAASTTSRPAPAAAADDVSIMGWCNRSQYGVHCESSGGYTTVYLDIDYRAGRVYARASHLGNAWLDGSNDGGRTWTTLGSTANYGAYFYLYRACTTDWLVTYVCTNWAN